MNGFLRRLDELWARFPRRARSTVVEPRQVFHIGGRKFEVVRHTTAEQDFWVMTRIRVAGLEKVEMRPDEDPEAFARRTLEGLMEGGQAFSLLAGLIVPVGAVWSLDLARDTEYFLRRLRTPADKATFGALVSTLLADFFSRGAISIVTSRSSSPLPGLTQDHPNGAVGPTSGVSGPPLFELSEDPTQNAGGR